ncbi:MAG: redoxin domain-containing protein [Flavobacteriaceae bacterium]|nr:redoxin domain-containing protein [Flavobacteriaceae bacterium]
MKKNIKILIVIILISTIGYLGYSISTKINHKNEIAERIQTIPNFSFKTLNGEPFTQNQISTTLPKLFIYFNSECDFCHAEAMQIQEHLEQLKNVQLLFVSFEEPESIKTFAEKYNLLNKGHIFFLEDSALLFANLFDAKSIPFMLLYTKDNRLIKKFKGATKIKNILKLLE